MPTVQYNILYRDQTTISDYEAERCRLDLYLPDVESSPVLLWLHGGGLVEGDKSGAVPVAEYLVEFGIGVALANYCLNPTVHYPAYLEDARAALDWLERNVVASGAGRRPLFIGGHSAGAYLAALVAMQPETGPQLAGAISISGQLVTHFTVRAERGIGPNTIVVDEAAPLHHVQPSVPPLCVLVSADDLPGRLEENQYFAAMMRVAGHQDTEFHVIPGRDHSSIGDLFGEPGDPVAPIVLKFLRNYS